MINKNNIFLILLTILFTTYSGYTQRQQWRVLTDFNTKATTVQMMGDIAIFQVGQDTANVTTLFDKDRNIKATKIYVSTITTDDSQFSILVNTDTYIAGILDMQGFDVINVSSINFTDNIFRSNGDAIQLGRYSENNYTYGIGIGRNSYNNYYYGIGIGYDSYNNNNYGIGIGYESKNNKPYSTSIGGYTYSASSSVSLGWNARSENIESVSLGAGAKTTAPKSVSIGAYTVNNDTETIKLGYNTNIEGDLTVSNTVYAHTGNFSEIFASTIQAKSPLVIKGDRVDMVGAMTVQNSGSENAVNYIKSNRGGLAIAISSGSLETANSKDPTNPQYSVAITSSGDVYAKRYFGDGSNLTGIGGGGASYIQLGGFMSDIYLSSSVPIDIVNIPADWTLTELIAFAVYGSTVGSTIFDIRYSTGTNTTNPVVWTSISTVELSTGTCKSSPVSISQSVNNTHIIGLFTNQIPSSGSLPVGTGVTIKKQ